MSRVGMLKDNNGWPVFGTELPSSTGKIKRWCPAKMVPSVGTAQREKPGKTERERAFLQAGRGSLPNRLISISPPCLRSSRPLFSSPSCLELREGEIEGCIQSSTSNTLHAPPSDPAPFCHGIGGSSSLHPRAGNASHGKKRWSKKKEGLKHQSVHQTHWVSSKQLTSAATWEFSWKTVKKMKSKSRIWFLF